jgi:hypothetical protein
VHTIPNDIRGAKTFQAIEILRKDQHYIAIGRQARVVKTLKVSERFVGSCQKGVRFSQLFVDKSQLELVDRTIGVLL